MLALKEILSECDCTVFFLEDYTAENPDLLLQSIAHGVVVLLEKTQSEYGSMKRTLQITKLRAGPSLEGSHDFAIRHGGLQVFRRLIASDSLNGVRPKDASGVLKTNNEELDSLTGGGVYWGTGLVLVGPAGTGKSTIGIQIVSAAATKLAHSCLTKPRLLISSGRKIWIWISPSTCRTAPLRFTRLILTSNLQGNSRIAFAEKWKTTVFACW